MRLRNIFKRTPAKKDMLIRSCDIPYKEIMEACRKAAYIGAGHKRFFVSEDGKIRLTFYGVIYESSYEFFEGGCDVWYEDQYGKKYLHSIDGVFTGPQTVKVVEEGSEDTIKQWLEEVNCNFKEVK